MDSKYLVICDQEKGFVSAFAAYIAKKKELALQIQTCSHISHVLSIQEKVNIDYLFVSEEIPKEKRALVKAKKVLVLTDGREVDVNEGEILVFKYQSGEALLSELIKNCNFMDNCEEGFLKRIKKKKIQIIGVFSPIHRIGKTSYALELGEEMAKQANVLYLNMELYGGNGGHFAQTDTSLSDLLYYFRQEQGNLGLLLTTLVQHRGDLDYIAPVQISEDLKNVSVEEWTKLVARILEQSIYEILILDLSEGILDIYSLLEMCTEIHMPIVHDTYATAKLLQFEKELFLLGNEELKKKITWKERVV